MAIKALGEGLGSKKMNQTQFLPQEFSWRRLNMKPGKDIQNASRKEELAVTGLISVDKQSDC